MIRLASLRRCNAGATAVEFALLAPIFFMMLFGLIEFSRMAWTKQTIGDVAYATARCMSVSSSCNTSALQKSYAVSRAAGEPFKDKLLMLPPFMLSAQGALRPGDVGAGLDLTGHFLEQFVFGPLNRPLPPARMWLIDRLREAGRL